MLLIQCGTGFCDIIDDSPRVRIYEEREAELDRQDSLDTLEEERLLER